jgi:hypothetical protein
VTCLWLIGVGPITLVGVLFWWAVRFHHYPEAGAYCECKWCRPWRGEQRYIWEWDDYFKTTRPKENPLWRKNEL